MKPAWHRHENVCCTKCGEVVYKSIACATRQPIEKCPIPKIARCPKHKRKRQRLVEAPRD